MAPPSSHLQSLLPGDPCLKLSRIQDHDGRVSIVAAAASTTARCPTCRRTSSLVHSRYWRTLRDLPWQGSAVELRIEVRRFRCRAHDCPRKTYVERLPLVMASHARQTVRLSETIRLIGYVLGGEAGSRLAGRLGMETSPDSVLRRVKHGPAATAPSIEVVGVDDWAWRKGQRYGTILIDLERHMPIDLLPDRSAESLEDWLKAHPGVQIISRDSAGAYAEGATKGAPDATQVADRFHLVCNLTSAVERCLEPKRAQLRTIADVVAKPVLPESATTQQPSAHRTRAQQLKEERRQRRLDCYNQVVELHRQGMSQHDISRALDLERKTVRRFLRAGQFPERAIPDRPPPRVDAFRDYLEHRWKQGCHNATQLWHEIQARGYAGGRSMVAHLVASFRTRGTKYFREQVAPPRAKRCGLSPRQAAMLMARQPDDLDEDQQRTLVKLTSSSPEIATMHNLMHEFGALLRGRRGEDFSQWMDHAIASGLPEMKRFCDGLQRDHAAVLAAIRLHWSNGQVEGQVHRLKLIKRQMYGRAGFALLRSRVLPFSQQSAAAVCGRGP
jgi:transposase